MREREERRGGKQREKAGREAGRRDGLGCVEKKRGGGGQEGECGGERRSRASRGAALPSCSSVRGLVLKCQPSDQRAPAHVRIYLGLNAPLRPRITQRGGNAAESTGNGWLR